MLQFNTIVCAAIVKSMPRSSWRFTRVLSSSSAVTTPNPLVDSVKDIANSEKISETENTKGNVSLINSQNSTTVSKAEPPKLPLSESVLNKVQTIDELLSIVDTYSLSKANTFKVMSMVMQMINSGKVNVDEIQTDNRFRKLQQKVADVADTRHGNDLNEKYDKLSTVEMIKVINNMVRKQEKDITALKYLTHQIVEHGKEISPENCAQLLSNMCTLDFTNKALLDKICKQLLTSNLTVTTNVFTSVVTSIGMLRYKDSHLLDCMCNYILYSKQTVHPYTITTLLYTFAKLGYRGPKVDVLIKKLVLPLTLKDFTKMDRWLNFVWSLTVLDKAEEAHYNSIFSRKFLKSFNGQSKEPKWTYLQKMKLLNINAAAEETLGNSPLSELSPDERSMIGDLPQNIEVAGYKKKLLNTLEETLKTLMSSENCYHIGVNSSMGFSIDAECYVDSQWNYVSEDSENVIRIAILLNTYGDYCRGEADLRGVNQLWEKLLKQKGYCVISISEHNFSISDDIHKRTKYLKSELKRAQLNWNTSLPQ